MWHWQGTRTGDIYGPGETMKHTVKDSGQRREFETGAVRDIQEGKGRLDLIPPIALERLSKHYEKGAKKYGEINWQRGIPCSSYIDSGMRHLLQAAKGMEDEDHIAAVMWNMAGLMWTLDQIEKGKLSADLDNRAYKES